MTDLRLMANRRKCFTNHTPAVVYKFFILLHYHFFIANFDFISCHTVWNNFLPVFLVSKHQVLALIYLQMEKHCIPNGSKIFSARGRSSAQVCMKYFVMIFGFVLIAVEILFCINWNAFMVIHLRYFFLFPHKLTHHIGICYVGHVFVVVLVLGPFTSFSTVQCTECCRLCKLCLCLNYWLTH